VITWKDIKDIKERGKGEERERGKEGKRERGKEGKMRG